jgi:hypothetical protein
MVMKFENRVFEDGIEYYGRYYGVYDGIIVSFENPEKMDRVAIRVPALMKENYVLWALPMGQHSSKFHGSRLPLSIGDHVDVMFRHGDLKHPVFIPSHFRGSEKPPEFRTTDTFGHISPSGIKFLYKEGQKTEFYVNMPGGNKVYMDSYNNISLENSKGVKLAIEKDSIKINDEEYITLGNELKALLEDLQAHITTWSTALVGPTGVPVIGTNSPTPDPNLTKWKLNLSKIISKFDLSL